MKILQGQYDLNREAYERQKTRMECREKKRQDYAAARVIQQTYLAYRYRCCVHYERQYACRRIYDFMLQSIKKLRRLRVHASVRIQRCWKRHRWIQRRSIAVDKIQNCVRMHLIRISELRFQSASLIQKAYLQKRWRSHYQSSLILQRAIRRHYQRSQLQLFVRVYDHLMDKKKQHSAARVIQFIFGKVTVRKHMCRYLLLSQKEGMQFFEGRIKSDIQKDKVIDKNDGYILGHTTARGKLRLLKTPRTRSTRFRKALNEEKKIGSK